jgi:hypothetical protein
LLTLYDTSTVCWFESAGLDYLVNLLYIRITVPYCYIHQSDI